MDLSKGILLLNLGTPDEPTPAAVGRYLREFLTDPYVLDIPWIARQILASLIIVPTRRSRSAAAYASIWDQQTGSPLLYHSQQLQQQLQQQLPLPCALAMRYGQPNIADALAQLTSAGVTELLLISLYPHHADSTRTTGIEAVSKLLPANMSLDVLPVFYDDADYINNLANSIRPSLVEPFDHLLLSYHGLPERHITNCDPTGNHCLQQANCCEVASPAHGTCYRHQVYATSKALQERLELPTDKVSVSFQSRLGRLPWLTPYTDHKLASLPGEGVKRLVVACPAFVADNLETLEEIGIQGRETFMAAGGESLRLAPCLNHNPDWVETLATWCAGTSAPKTTAGGSNATIG